MRKLVILLIFAIALPVFAQSDASASAAFQAVEVSNVRLRLSENDGIALVFNATPAVCEELLVDIKVDGQYIEVDVFAPNSDTVCNFVAPYEGLVQLPDLATGQAYILFFNNYASPFYLNNRGDDSTVEPFSMLWGEDNILFELSPIPPDIDSIDFSPNNGTIELRLRGNHTDGCITDEYTRVRQDDVQANLYHVEPFRLLTPIVMCPDELIPFETTLQLELSEGDILEIDGNYFRIENNEPFGVTQETLIIQSVEILATSTGNIVVVQGTQDCGFEMDAYVSERDFVSMIDIVAYVPVNTACGDLTTPYEASFTVSNLPVIINGTAYDENGVLDPNASGQSVNPPVEGNVMPVDTVIESVEVAILESFPMQLQLTVSGYQPDGCDFPVEVTQTVDGNNVTLHIFRNIPIDALCPMVLVTYEDSIMIEGGFEGGTVNIQVNEFITSVDL